MGLVHDDPLKVGLVHAGPVEVVLEHIDPFVVELDSHGQVPVGMVYDHSAAVDSKSCAGEMCRLIVVDMEHSQIVVYKVGPHLVVDMGCSHLAADIEHLQAAVNDGCLHLVVDKGYPHFVVYKVGLHLDEDRMRPRFAVDKGCPHSVDAEHHPVDNHGTTSRVISMSGTCITGV